jgi:flap endonuclease-1
MGVNLKGLVSPEKIWARTLNGRCLALDADNHLYQFLTAIRTPQGEPVCDSRGRPVSHLLGLFSRSVNLIKNGLRLVYVFDGKPPELKSQTVRRRQESRQRAAQDYEQARERGDREAMRRQAVRASRLQPEMVEEAKELVAALGLPMVQAPSEADAQAALMVRKDDCYAVSSSDYDPLLHGATRLVRRLTGSEGRQEQAELIELSSLLEKLGIDHDRLLALAVMVGTDYNPGGVHGIGFKKGLKILREKSIEEAFQGLEPEFDWREILRVFREMPVSSSYSLQWKPHDARAIRRLLVEQREFSEDRVEKRLQELAESAS